MTGLNIKLLRKNPPANGEDFARKLLEGAYTSDQVAQGRADMRENLQDDIQRTYSTYKRTHTREMECSATLTQRS